MLNEGQIVWAAVIMKIMLLECAMDAAQSEQMKPIMQCLRFRGGLQTTVHNEITSIFCLLFHYINCSRSG